MPKSSNHKRTKKRVAFFVSPHGFGHAARSAAVMQAVARIEPSIRFEIFTTVPSWFFQESLTASFSCHDLLTDIGLVQKTAFLADLDKTLRSLDDFLPFRGSLIAEISATIRDLKCALIVCDISPLGIPVAKAAGLPSVLVENFTWDWIYQPYTRIDDRFNRHIEYLRSLFQSVNYHIKIEPFCERSSAALTTSPVSRTNRTSGNEVRKRLELPPAAKMVLITTGGIAQNYNFFEKLVVLPDVHFVIPGAGQQLERRDNLIILPPRSGFYHPDLVNAADAVIGKVGYSTLAEVYHAGVPFGYVTRSNFRETEPMVAFIEKKMPGIFLEESEFGDGSWTTKLDELLSISHIRRHEMNGAEQIGKFITGIAA